MKMRLVEVKMRLHGSDPVVSYYAIPDDGRDIMKMTLSELRRYPEATASLMLAKAMADLRQKPKGDCRGG